MGGREAKSAAKRNYNGDYKILVSVGGWNRLKQVLDVLGRWKRLLSWRVSGLVGFGSLKVEVIRVLG